MLHFFSNLFFGVVRFKNCAKIEIVFFVQTDKGGVKQYEIQKDRRNTKYR